MDGRGDNGGAEGFYFVHGAAETGPEEEFFEAPKGVLETVAYST